MEIVSQLVFPFYFCNFLKKLGCASLKILYHTKGTGFLEECVLCLSLVLHSAFGIPNSCRNCVFLKIKVSHLFIIGEQHEPTKYFFLKGLENKQIKDSVDGVVWWHV